MRTNCEAGGFISDPVLSEKYFSHASPMLPFYSTGNGAERSGMGFCVMQTFMDAVEVNSVVGEGTTVLMRKRIEGETALRRERVLDEIG